MSYAAIKMIHVTSVVISYLLFSLRGIWMMQDSVALKQRWVKITPHIVDTVLLTSAIALAVKIGQDPIHDSWLGAKVVGLLIYIALGMVTLRFGKTRNARIYAWIAAQFVFFYIVLVAVTKNPALYFGATS
ncbi:MULTISPECIES: SirB2 family protein [unclassified Nitrosospira]|uniref:SirB2 family protein n=1 Tax=unclassified Nitrosospira TaxID=2609267 RepID=UPI000D301915|nr:MULTISPECIES: SirB2 family protein [unclassified Nitrosospira]PTR17093.1 putative membrane protein SirB2 [Nitrosospira sp. Nsp2]WON74559.1 SirB2 family protein [Nitrosospira sp. Is2]